MLFNTLNSISLNVLVLLFKCFVIGFTHATDDEDFTVASGEYPDSSGDLPEATTSRKPQVGILTIFFTLVILCFFI